MRGEEKVGIEIEHAALAERHATAAVGLAAIGVHYGQHVVEHSGTLQVVAKEGSIGCLEEEVAQDGDEHSDDEESGC